MINCGISRWDDPDKINAQLKALTEEPIWEVNDDYYENVILKYYDEKLALRDQEETLIDDNFVKTNINEDKNAGVINKVFGHFFD